MVFVLFLLVLPVIEIALFAAVGDEIGALNTVLLCLGSGAVGVFLVQSQGFKSLQSIQNSMNGGTLPVDEIFRGVCVFVAGMLLILPGFFTDMVAVFLLIPPVQHVVRQWGARYFTGEPMSFRTAGRGQDQGDIVDAEYTHVETDDDEAGTRLEDLSNPENGRNRP